MELAAETSSVGGGMSERNASTVWNVLGSEKTSVIYHSLGPASEEPATSKKKSPGPTHMPVNLILKIKLN